MVVARPLRLAPEWDGRVTRMMGVSAVAHVLVIAAALAVAERSGPVPLPLVAYTVQITDANDLGGRLPAGAPGRDLSGGPIPAPSPPPQAEPPAGRTAEAEAKVEPAEEKPPEPPPVVKHEPPLAEPKPEPKPEPRPAPKPAAKAQTATTPTAVAKPESRPAARTEGATVGQRGSRTGDHTAPPRDAYATLAERWKGRTGGGLGGEGGSGPIGAGGDGKGGGGQLVGLEFLAYRQQVINTVKERWTNVFARPGLVAAVRFAIAPDGELSNIRIEQSSGNAAYDSSATRAVQHASPLPPPPARYAKEFQEFVIEFHSEEKGGGDTG